MMWAPDAKVVMCKDPWHLLSEKGVVTAQIAEASAVLSAVRLEEMLSSIHKAGIT